MTDLDKEVETVLKAIDDANYYTTPVSMQNEHKARRHDQLVDIIIAQRREIKNLGTKYAELLNKIRTPYKGYHCTYESALKNSWFLESLFSLYDAGLRTEVMEEVERFFSNTCSEADIFSTVDEMLDEEFGNT